MMSRPPADPAVSAARMPVLRPSPVHGARTNTLATAALVCGIVQFCGAAPAGIAAIVLGHMARSQIRRTGEAGDNHARTGLTLGYIGLALGVLTILFLLVASSESPMR